MKQNLKKYGLIGIVCLGLLGVGSAVFGSPQTQPVIETQEFYQQRRGTIDLTISAPMDEEGFLRIESEELPFYLTNRGNEKLFVRGTLTLLDKRTKEPIREREYTLRVGPNAKDSKDTIYFYDQPTDYAKFDVIEVITEDQRPMEEYPAEEATGRGCGGVTNICLLSTGDQLTFKVKYLQTGLPFGQRVETYSAETYTVDISRIPGKNALGGYMQVFNLKELAAEQIPNGDQLFDPRSGYHVSYKLISVSRKPH